ncbi:MAG: hypothetical protein ACAI44_03275 [Candidatus Sericytochromatia bacterium]
MALPLKGSRKITCEGFDYLWIATGNDGWIDLTVQLRDSEGQKLTASFDYASEITEEDEGRQRHRQRRRITPALVRELILWALDQGWDPTALGVPPFEIRSDQAATLWPAD